MYNKNRYKTNINKTINQVTPHIFRGRWFISVIQSFMFPLQSLADKLNEIAIEKKIEACMTSQTMYFEWFLNRKLYPLLDDKSKKIYLKNSPRTGTPVFLEKEKGKSVLVAYNENETYPKDRKSIKHAYEDIGEYAVSFIVSVPSVSNQQEFNNVVKYWVDKYKVVGKTYKIIIQK